MKKCPDNETDEVSEAVTVAQVATGELEDQTYRAPVITEEERLEIQKEVERLRRNQE